MQRATQICALGAPMVKTGQDELKPQIDELLTKVLIDALLAANDAAGLNALGRRGGSSKDKVPMRIGSSSACGGKVAAGDFRRDASE